MARPWNRAVKLALLRINENRSHHEQVSFAGSECKRGSYLVFELQAESETRDSCTAVIPTSAS